MKRSDDLMNDRWLCLLLTALLLLLTACQTTEAEETENFGIRVTFFDVGKGDAILVETEEETLLLDTGYDGTADVLLNYFDAQGIKKLDYLILTHFDKDHVGGADQVLEAVETGRVLEPDYVSDSRQYLEYAEVLEAEGIVPEKVTETMTLSLSGAELLIYPPQKQEYEEADNDYSLIVSMTCAGKGFLFAGDAEKERLEELLSQEEFTLSHTVLKVPHHGRKEKNSGEFFKAVSPEAAIITCSEEAPPDDRVLKLLKACGSGIYLTSEGTVVCTLKDETLKIQQ